ncbi:MAG: SipW-dependent-type signal peptide-containing protein [Euryarchaeota archaeon]|nr:SipW-dependent-type signal peptide-containing protein [Euryarchaeota archaeon]
MNKKIISLLFLLILLVSVTGSYAYFNQSTPVDNHQTDSGTIIDAGTLANVIDSTFLNETQGIEIGEMI